MSDVDLGPLEAALLKVMRRDRLTPARPLKTLEVEMMQMTACIAIKRAIFDAPQKIGRGARIFFIFRKSQLDHSSNLYLKQL